MRFLRILTVDDHELVRRGVRKLLASRPEWFICGEASDGVDGLERAKNLRPDLVLMDVSMPRMNGLDATRAIRNDLPDAKVILVSQNDPVLVREQAAEVKAHGYVGKADLVRDLVPTIERICGSLKSANGSKPTVVGTIPPENEWIKRDGEMGGRLRSTDWAKTQLGSPETWSPALRMMVNFLLANRFPQLLWWGPDFCSLYNDAYVPILGGKHPWAIGKPVREVWHEIWHILKPLIETPFHGGPATWMDDIPLEIKRRGFIEETHFTIAYSPVPDESVPSGIGGVLATVHEITEKVVGERRTNALRDLGARSVEPKTSEEACTIAADTLAGYAKDVPFVLFYLLDESNRSARLVCDAGLCDEDRARLSTIDPASSGDAGWPISDVLQTEQIRAIESLSGKFHKVPHGPWSDPPDSAAVVPIRSNMARKPAGFMIVGLSPRLKFDDSYRNFLELMSTQIATTISQARAYEEERKRAAALAELDRAKTTFFSNVSHEFRTPLTLMLSPLQDLLARSQDHLSATAQEQLELVNRNGARLLRLVNTLLDFSRIEAGRVDAVYQATDLASVTRELASVFRSATERAGLKLVVDCEDLSEPVYVDGDMWEKIVLNLISNAFKFTFDGEIAISLRRAGEMAELRVRDTGVGVPAEEMPKLFERFHRIPNTRSRTYEGSGIGLALVNELVKLHGGSMRVESVLGQGSTFIVSIPFGQDHLDPARVGGSRTLSSTAVGATPFVDEALRWLPDSGIEQQETASSDFLPISLASVVNGVSASRPRVIIADDNADMRQYLLRLLGERYEVEALPDGQAALEAARRNLPDLLLSDVMMPRLDGLGLLRELRADPKLKEIPIILLSARAGEESRLRGVEGGADDYLVKPFSSRELTARVEAHVKMHRLREQAKAKQQQLVAEYETLLQQAPIGIYLVDSGFRLRQVNPVAQPVFGNVPGLIGRDFDEVIHILWTKDYADEIVRIFRHTLETGEPYATNERAEKRLDRGVTEYYEWRADRIPLPDGTYGVVCYFRDISAQVKARTALAQSEKLYRELAETLERQVRERTFELESQNLALERQSEEVRSLSARLLQSQDEERRRVARELHDSAGQTLAALAMEHARIAASLKAHAPELVKELDPGEKLVRLLVQEIRTTSYLLHPPLLDETGLAGALRWYVEGLVERSGLNIQLELAEDFGRLSSEMELTVFRIVQEALTNVHRHSGSKEASIRVVRDHSQVHVEIRDQGRGISPERLKQAQSQGLGVGLRGMRERVYQLHGSIKIQSDSSGTAILATFPIADLVEPSPEVTFLPSAPSK